MRAAWRCPNWCWKTAPACRAARRISAEGLGRVLQAAWKSAVMPELMASLPVTATDGTMKRRLKQNGVAGQAHIKTGSLEGVRSIAGWVLDKAGRRWIVVFFVNHANAAAAQAAQDALLDWVYAGRGT
jgi:D-alanyl-D-alanine carboxypeptidase/D-alanyl-D-alanine-endopeptidase (penicillin-binding protein 4)